MTCNQSRATNLIGRNVSEISLCGGNSGYSGEKFGGRRNCDPRENVMKEGMKGAWNGRYAYLSFLLCQRICFTLDCTIVLLEKDGINRLDLIMFKEEDFYFIQTNACASILLTRSQEKAHVCGGICMIHSSNTNVFLRLIPRLRFVTHSSSKAHKRAVLE